jgi:hypothetical protein
VPSGVENMLKFNPPTTTKTEMSGYGNVEFGGITNDDLLLEKRWMESIEYKG